MDGGKLLALSPRESGVSSREYSPCRTTCYRTERETQPEISGLGALGDKERDSLMNQHAGRMVQRFTKLNVDTGSIPASVIFIYRSTPVRPYFDPILRGVDVRGIVSDVSSSVDISSHSNWGKLGQSRVFLTELRFFGLFLSSRGKKQYD